MRLCSQVISFNPSQSVLDPEVINEAPTSECYASQYEALRLSMGWGCFKYEFAFKTVQILSTSQSKISAPSSQAATVHRPPELSFLIDPFLRPTIQSEEHHFRKPLHPNFILVDVNAPNIPNLLVTKRVASYITSSMDMTTKNGESFYTSPFYFFIAVGR